MQKLDCLIIHTPKFNNYYKPVGQFMWVNYMPLGLLGIADYLHRNGFKCRVLHQGIEWMNRKSWKLEDSLNSAPPRSLVSRCTGTIKPMTSSNRVKKYGRPILESSSFLGERQPVSSMKRL